MKLHIFVSGQIICRKHLLVRNAPAGVRFTVPVPFYLLEHEKGLFLFDTGQQPTQRKYDAGENFIPVATEKDKAVNILKENGIAPHDIAGIILSHHHADHSAGIADFPEIPCYVRKEELQYPRWAEQYDSGKWIFPEKNYDLCHDGRIILLPTPGHTDGHQSLLLTMDDGKRILLTADAAYTPEALEMIPPEREALMPFWQTIRSFRKYAAENVRIITGHDPELINKLKNKAV